MEALSAWECFFCIQLLITLLYQSNIIRDTMESQLHVEDTQSQYENKQDHAAGLFKVRKMCIPLGSQKY